MPGLTLDTGALIALERREPRFAKRFAVAVMNRRSITVPTAVIAQWWRGQRGPQWQSLVDAVAVEPLDHELARLVGEALAVTRTSDIVDAIVVASAALRGDVVYTTDVDDLARIAASVFPNVRIFSV